MIYESINRQVLECVPRSSKHVLDLGCGTGVFGKRLRETLGCRVTGVTYSQEEAKLAQPRLNEVVVGDLNEFDPQTVRDVDCAVCSHVLEHLYRPEHLLSRLARALPRGGTLVVALPNVLQWRQRLRFLGGRFRYTDGGLMDRTHYRFFDWNTAQGLLREGGFRVDRAQACGGFPGTRFMPGLGGVIDKASTALFPGLFSWQFVMVGTPDRAA